MIRAEMPLELETELFYFVVKDASSQSQSIVELRILNTDCYSSMTHTKRTIFTSSTGDIIALEYDRDTFSSDNEHRLFVVD